MVEEFYVSMKVKLSTIFLFTWQINGEKVNLYFSSSLSLSNLEGLNTNFLAVLPGREEEIARVSARLNKNRIQLKKTASVYAIIM